MKKMVGTAATASNSATLLMVLLMFAAPSPAQGETASNATAEETHALIKELIVGQPILQNYWHKMDFPQYNHFDEAVWSVVMYEGDECQVTYRREIEIAHKAPKTVKPIYGDKPETIIGHKIAKFDMAQVEAIEIHDYEDSRGSVPSVGIRFVAPTREWQVIGRKAKKKIDLSEDPVLKPENAISVLAKDSQRLLQAFQRLQALCQ
jgi:hypothetical protein